MLTIFTIPKPFTDPHINIIQRNAIKSWTLLRPACDIILVGNDQGVSEVAKEFGLKHLPNVSCNEFGTPLLNSALALAGQESQIDLLCYINADIILLDDFLSAIQKVDFGSFLMVGQRYDVNIKNLIDFDNKDWRIQLRDKLKREGKLHDACGIDYFVFNKNDWQDFPPFAVGRPRWDNWFIYKAKQRDIPVIDATKTITAIHQNHRLTPPRLEGPEKEKNLELSKEMQRVYTIDDADWKLTKNGLKKKSKLKSIKRRIKDFFKI